MNPSYIPLSIALFISLNNFEVARLEEKTIAIIYEKKVIFLARSNLICGGCELDRVDVGLGWVLSSRYLEVETCNC